jgi:hypothetical protein
MNLGLTAHASDQKQNHKTRFITDKNSFDTSVDASIRPDWNPAQLKVAVIVQVSGHGRILGAAQIPYQGIAFL